MTIPCPHCKQDLKISDDEIEKLPKGETQFYLWCGNCKREVNFIYGKY